MGHFKQAFAAGVTMVALTALLSWSGRSWAGEPSPQDSLRQVSIMAKVLETRLNEELPGGVVGASIFQPGGVRSFRVPGVGVIFQLNVNFPVAEPKTPAKTSEPAKDEDLWDRIERGGSARGQGGGGFGGGGSVIASVSPAAPPAAPVLPTPPSHGGGFGGVAMAVSPAAPPGASTAPSQPGVPHMAFLTPTEPHGGAGDSRQKVATMERVILETLGRYGDRLKAIPDEENIIVLVSGGGTRHHISAMPTVQYSMAHENVQELEKAIGEMQLQMAEAGKQMKATGDEMKEVGEEMKAVGEQMAEAKREAKKAKDKKDAEAQEAAEAKMKDLEAKMKVTEEKMETAAAKMKVTEDKMHFAEAKMKDIEKDKDWPADPWGRPYVLHSTKTADAQVKAAEARMKDAQARKSKEISEAQKQYDVALRRQIEQQVKISPDGRRIYTFSYGPGGDGGGGSSWVLKVKKSELVKDADELRKRADIQSYAADIQSYTGLVDPGSDDLVIDF